MREISNRSIVILLSIALVLAVASIILNAHRFQQATAFSEMVTSAATSSGIGETNLTISSSTSLTNQNALINFGSGTVNASCDFCQMDSNQTTVSLFSNGSNLTQTPTLANCCVSFTVVSSGFLLENTGNVNLSVGYTCTGNCTFASFLGGSRAPGMGGLEIRVAPNSIARQSGESGVVDTTVSCQGGGSTFRDTQWNITNGSDYGGSGGGAVNGTGGNEVYRSLSSRGHWLCGNYTNPGLDSDNSRDAGVVDINVTIPGTAPATGVRTSFRLTFNGTDSAG